MNRILICLFLALWAPGAHAADETPPEEDRPPNLHRAMRAGIDLGRGDYAGNVIGIEYRLMLHDLIDPGPGHSRTAVGELLKLRLSYLTRPATLRLDELTILRMMQIPPQNTAPPGEREWSWKLRLGAETVRDASCDHCVATVIEGGYGIAVQPVRKFPLVPFALVDAQVSLSPRFDHFLKLAAGPSGGVRVHFGETVAALIQARYYYQVLTTAHDAYQVGGEVRWEAVPELVLRVFGGYWPDGWEGNAGVLYYF